MPLEHISRTDNGQRLQLAALETQKQHVSLNLKGLYAHADFADWFNNAHRKSGKALSMGKSGVRS